MVRQSLRIGGIAGVLAIGAVVAFGSFAQQPAARLPDADSGAVPVTIVRAAREDVPVFTEGVGTVEAFYNVLVRSRVDGTLMQVPVREGQQVKPGDLIAEIDPRPYKAALDQATAKKQQDQAALANARLNLGRYSSLARQDFASRQQVDTQQALVAQDAAAIAGDQAAIEAAQLNLDFCYIRSPIAGRAGLRLVDPGNLVHATDATGIITITQEHPIAATFTLPQEEVPKVAATMAKGVTPVLAYSSDDQTQLDSGTLLTPDNSIDTSTGTIKLKAQFPNPHNTLWPGQFIDAHLQLGIARNVITVPESAIQHGPNGLFVYLIRPNDTTAVQPVSVGYQTSRLAVVTKGLRGGENVVVDGASRLDVGTRVAATVASQAS